MSTDLKGRTALVTGATSGIGQGVVPRLQHPAQIGATAVFLASDGAANIHGAVIPVDGGFTAI
jgi:NAD(P)-dependent dehydrogenase (short-subunit alcohol dehydrogenase family)